MFSVLGFRIKTQKSYWKPNSSVILSTSWILQIFVHFWSFLLLCGLVSTIFTMFFRDSEVCLEIYDWYGDFGYLTKKINIFIWREICKRTHCPPIVTLALLLFLHGWTHMIPSNLYYILFSLVALFFRIKKKFITHHCVLSLNKSFASFPYRLTLIIVHYDIAQETKEQIYTLI